MRMLLTLNRRNRKGLIVERRRQLSRSFTLGMMECLYALHAELQYNESYLDAYDINKGKVKLDGDGRDNYITQFGLAASPGGSLTNQLYAYSYGGYPEAVSHPSELLGIMVGNGTTAVTPEDRRLEKLFGHGTRPLDGSPVKFENYITGDDDDQELYGDDWGLIPFTPATTHLLYSVKLKLWKEGTPPENIEVFVVPFNPFSGTMQGIVPNLNYLSNFGSGELTPATITDTSAPGGWYEFVLSSPDYVYAGQTYFIAVRQKNDGGTNLNCYHLRYDTADATYDRVPRGDYGNMRCYTSNGGSSFSWTFGNFVFEEWGESLGELKYGGCGVEDMTISDPNGQFDIVRHMKNGCGSSLTINEIGLAAYGNCTYLSTYIFGGGHIILIARDIVSPGIALADGELLEATYTPQITV